MKQGFKLFLLLILGALYVPGYRVAAGIPAHWPRIPPAHGERIVATASSQYLTEGPERAVNGNLGNYWQTRESGEHWIQLDLGDPFDLETLEVYMSGSSYQIQSYVLYIGNDPADWASEDRNDWGAPVAEGALTNTQGYHPIHFDPVNARYVRLVITEHHSTRLYLYDLRLYPGFVIASASTGANDAKLAINGNLSNFWRPSDGIDPADEEQWIQFDLGALHEVDGLEIYSHNEYRMQGYRVHLSDEPDPSDWGEPLAEGYLPEAAGYHPIDFAPTVGRYLRLVVTSRWDTRVYLRNVRISSRSPISGQTTPWMYATASQIYSASTMPILGIDGNPGTSWQTRSSPEQWIQVDLGARYAVGAIAISHASSQYRIRHFRLHVADEPDPPDWGPPVAVGELPDEPGYHPVVFDLTPGRYLRLVVATIWDARIYLFDMPIYGFKLHPLTGNQRYTHSTTIAVEDFPVFDGYSHYQITENDAPPTGDWLPVYPPPKTHTFAEPPTDGIVALTAWYTNLSTQVALRHRRSEIVYTDAAPTATVHPSLTRYVAATLTVADLDAGSTGGLVDFTHGMTPVQGPFIPLDMVAKPAPGTPLDFTLSLAADADETPDRPEVTLTSPGVYDVVLTVVNEAGRTASATTTVTVASTVTEGITRIWTGVGADALASTPGNWDPAGTPETGDNLVFDATSSADCEWDLDIVPASWTQTEDYGGTVTIHTRYPGQGSFNLLSVAGDVTLLGGVLTHPANIPHEGYGVGLHEPLDRLAMAAGGNFTLGGTATIDLDGRGFGPARGPGRGSRGSREDGFSASHGGAGGANPATSGTYGSITRPETLGSGADGPGGGAMFLTVAGSATIDGNILARGINTRTSSIDRYCHGSGGSIYIRAEAINGGGILDAGLDTSKAAYYGSGGGRIALIAGTSGMFDSLTLRAFSHTQTRNGGGRAGTIYLEAPGMRQVIVDQNNTGTASGNFTDLPAALEAGRAPDFGGSLEGLELVARNRAFVRLARDLRLDDLDELSSTSTLDLHGFTLFMAANKPAGFPDLEDPSDDPVEVPPALGGGTIAPADGRVLWGNLPPQYRIAIRPEPNGLFEIKTNGDFEPYDPETFYAGNLTLRAVPDTGYAFVRWIGSLPAGADPLDPELALTAGHGLHFRGHFAAADNTRTWTGGSAHNLFGTQFALPASAAANWQPWGVPQHGEGIVLDGISFSKAGLTWDLSIPDYHVRLADWYAHGLNMDWDLDIEPAFWDQTAYYTRTVTLFTRYPDAGGMTNLTVAGDLTIDGGRWTHRANAPDNLGEANEDYRLAFSAGGNFRLGTNAVIDLDGIGFAPARGPGAGASAERTSPAASYGGTGAHIPGEEAAAIYGSITQPESLGSGAFGPGGGALHGVVGGTATLDGLIRARGLNPATSNIDRRNHGSGGSIYLHADAIAGTGTLLAGLDDSVTAYHGSGGGRIALVADGSGDFGGMTLDAGTIDNTGVMADGGRAGTIYLEADGAGRLRIDQGNIGTASDRFTDLVWPPGYEPNPVLAIGPLAKAELDLRNGAFVRLMTDLRMRDLGWISEDSMFHLNGYTLYLTADEPADFPDLSESSEDPVSIPAALGGGTIVPEGGRVRWAVTDVSYELPVWSGGPEGAIAGYEYGERYVVGSAQTFTATPAEGYAFLRWIGTLPVGFNETNPELTITIQPDMHFRALFVSSDPDTRTWIGGPGSDMLASTADNWYPPVTPVTGNHIVFNGAAWTELTWDMRPLAETPYADDEERLTDWLAHSAHGGIWYGDYYGFDGYQSMHRIDIDWDLDIIPASWTQTEYFSGRITIPTGYPEAGGDTLEIVGDFKLEGGVWTHPGNTGGHEAADRLAIFVGGNFNLGSHATINLDGRGYAAARGPGAGTTGSRSSTAASHGGMGGYEDGTQPAPTYGSITQPEALGSGAQGPGGGALFLTVTGAATLDGIVSAEGVNRRTTDIERYHHGAGGSIFLRAGSINGAGTVRAGLDTSQAAYFGSGGGRIALVATNHAVFSSFDNLVLEAGTHDDPLFGGGGAGTIYLETPDNAWLIVDQAHIVMAADNTPLAWDPGTVPHPMMTNGPLANAHLEIRDGAVIRLRSDVRMRNLGTLSETSTLLLNGHTLYMQAAKPDGFPDLSEPSADPVAVPEALGGGMIVPQGGRILWYDADARYLLPVWTGGPEGSLAGYTWGTEYTVGDPLTVTAVPAEGYDFVRWIGTLPDGFDPSNPDLAITVQPDMHFRALFAGSDPGTRTWIGGPESDMQASTAENWCPDVVPEEGDHIVMNGAAWTALTWDMTPIAESRFDHESERLRDWLAHSADGGVWRETFYRYQGALNVHAIDIDWDLEIEPASWTQTEYFAGRVTIPTRFPDAGGYTNLMITGNLTLNGGAWRHPANTGGDDPTDRLSATVGGDFVLGPHGMIELDARGYASSRGPGAGNTSRTGSSRSASHGGAGARNLDESVTYGWVVYPTALGSGAFGGGGGALHAIVDGAATLDGIISAQGVNTRTEDRDGEYCHGSGGSIYLRAASVTGAGIVRAGVDTLRNAYYGSGGGRIALVATQNALFDTLTLEAYPHYATRDGGGRAGTIYLQSPSERRLIVDQNQIGGASDNFTDLLGIPGAGDVHPQFGVNLPDVTLVARNGAFIALNHDLRLWDFMLEDDSRLNLRGHTLTLRVYQHEDWGQPHQIEYEGGNIVWLMLPRGTMFLVK